MIHSIGEILVDVYNQDSKESFFAGGAPYNLACNIAHFGGDVSFYGIVGNDDYGVFLRHDAKLRHFSKLVLVKSSSRCTTQAKVTLNNGDRTFEFIRKNGADYCFNMTRFFTLRVQKDDIVHLGSLMLSEARGRRFFAHVCEYAHKVSAYTSLDINYREDIFVNQKSSIRIYRNIIKDIDYLKFSVDELLLIAHKKTIRGALNSLIKPNQTVLVTDGDKGSYFYHNHELIYVKSKKVDSLDSTGAGDAFYSYFLFELDKHPILDNKKIIEILNKCNAVGALATLKKGAIDVVPSLAELDIYLD